jgi:hypothetical protein
LIDADPEERHAECVMDEDREEGERAQPVERDDPSTRLKGAAWDWRPFRQGCRGRRTGWCWRVDHHGKERGAGTMSRVAPARRIDRRAPSRAINACASVDIQLLSAGASFRRKVPFVGSSVDNH